MFLWAWVGQNVDELYNYILYKSIYGENSFKSSIGR